MRDDGKQVANSFPELLTLAGCDDETELAEALTDYADPRGVTGLIVDVVHDGEWALHVPGHWAMAITFPTTLAWLLEAAEDLLRETLEQIADAAAQTTADVEINDPTVLEAASWALASTLLRRHPARLRLIRAHPAGGQADCLSLLPTDGGTGDIRLNRAGRIHVIQRFDRRPVTDLAPIPWPTYLAAKHADFLKRLEAAAGLPHPHTTPGANPLTLTVRVLAAITATAFKAKPPIEIQPGYIDTSGYGAGPNDDAFAAFPHISDDLIRARPDDFYEQPGYRFWFVIRGGRPVLAFEQSEGIAWTTTHKNPISLLQLYRSRRRDANLTAIAPLNQAARSPSWG